MPFQWNYVNVKLSIQYLPQCGEIVTQTLQFLCDQMLRSHFRWQMGHATCQRNHMRFESLETFVYALKRYGSLDLFDCIWERKLVKVPSCHELCVCHRFACDLVSVVHSPNSMATMTRCHAVVEIQLSVVWAARAFAQAFVRCQAFATPHHTCAPDLRVVFECGEYLVYPFRNRSPIGPFPMDRHQSATPSPMIVWYSTFDHYPIQTLTKRGKGCKIKMIMKFDMKTYGGVWAMLVHASCPMISHATIACVSMILAIRHATAQSLRVPGDCSCRCRILVVFDLLTMISSVCTNYYQATMVAVGETSTIRYQKPWILAESWVLAFRDRECVAVQRRPHQPIRNRRFCCWVATANQNFLCPIAELCVHSSRRRCHVPNRHLNFGCRFYRSQSC